MKFYSWEWEIFRSFYYKFVKVYYANPLKKWR